MLNVLTKLCKKGWKKMFYIILYSLAQIQSFVKVVSRNAELKNPSIFYFNWGYNKGVIQ